MKPNRLYYAESEASARGRAPGLLPAAGLDSRRKLRGQMERIKQSLLRESTALRRDEQILRSALNEAEALAWQTPFPHLFFPVLAQEKAASVREWTTKQRAIRQASLAFAA
jgi:hypothetical protein